MIFIHKKTKQRLLLKKSGDLVSTYYVLDNNLNKILDKNEFGKEWFNVNGNKVYKTAICHNENVISNKENKSNFLKLVSEDKNNTLDSIKQRIKLRKR